MPNQSSKPIAVQLYSLRHLQQSLADTLKQVADIGYRGVETIGDHGLPADEMKALLEANNLVACSTHVQLNVLEEELERTIAFNQAIGNDCLILPVPPQEFRSGVSADEWLQFGRRLDAIGQRCTDAGMRFLYHNHAWEMAELDGKLALDWLFEGASAENLQWEPDIAWIVRGGADSVELLMRYSGRSPRVHVKDIAPAGENEDQMGFADVGHGVLDWSLLLPAAEAAGAEWYIVEHDLPKDPVNTVLRSYQFLDEELR